MLASTKNFINGQFQRYYAANQLQLPSDHTHREWAVITEGGMRRHLGFGTAGEINDYIKAMHPAHVYHSVAYYDYPSAPTMQEKGWKGADLIFDLDADHLGLELNSTRQMLDAVKESTRLLVDDFLLDELGVAEKDLSIVFSGNRGYHVHISDPRMQRLESPERREIVDYVTGVGMDMKAVLTQLNTQEKVGMVWYIRGFENGGWKRRIGHYLHDRLEVIAGMEEKDIIKSFADYVVLDEEWKPKLDEEGETKPLVTRGKAARLLEYASHVENRKAVLNEGKMMFGNTGLHAIVEQMLVNDYDYICVHYGCGIDAPVTADIKRLIRVPGSLHGKSGLRVMSLTRKEFEEFDPLRDAVYFSDESVKARVLHPVEVELKGKRYKLSAGTGNVPLYLAVYLMGHGHAEYVL